MSAFRRATERGGSGDVYGLTPSTDSALTQSVGSAGSWSGLLDASQVDIYRVQRLLKEKEEHLRLVRNRIEKLKGAEAKVWREITSCRENSTQLQEAALRNQKRTLERLRAEREREERRERLYECVREEREYRLSRLRVVRSAFVQSKRETGEAGRLENKARFIAFNEAGQARVVERECAVAERRHQTQFARSKAQERNLRRRQERSELAARKLLEVEAEMHSVEEQYEAAVEEESKWITRLQNSQVLRRHSQQELEMLTAQGRVPPGVKASTAASVPGPAKEPANLPRAGDSPQHRPGRPLGQIVEEPSEESDRDGTPRGRDAHDSRGGRNGRDGRIVRSASADPEPHRYCGGPRPAVRPARPARPLGPTGSMGQGPRPRREEPRGARSDGALSARGGRPPTGGYGARATPRGAPLNAAARSTRGLAASAGTSPVAVMSSPRLNPRPAAAGPGRPPLSARGPRSTGAPTKQAWAPSTRAAGPTPEQMARMSLDDLAVMQAAIASAVDSKRAAGLAPGRALPDHSPGGPRGAASPKAKLSASMGQSSAPGSL